MNRHLLPLIFFFVFHSQKSLACDGCNFFDYASINNRTNIALVYSYRHFQGYEALSKSSDIRIGQNMNPFAKVMHEPEETGISAEKTSNDYEFYTTLQIRGSYNINEKWLIGLILPYEKNEVYYERVFDDNIIRPVFDSIISISGFGDPIILLDRLFIINKKQIKHTIRPGFGLKLPFGNVFKSESYDPVLLPGSGSIDIIFRINYQLIYNNLGMNLLQNYRYNNKGVNDYINGNALNLSIEPFYIIKLNEMVSVIPHTGVYQEYKRKDMDKNRLVNLSGGNNTFYQFGIDIKVKNVSLINSYQKPISQSPNGDQILNYMRFNSSLMWNF